MLRSCLLAATLLMAPVAVLAQSMKMPGATPDAAPVANEPPSTTGYRDAMNRMGQGMSITYSGNADRDFVAGMIAHHQGAIDMARVELKYGKVPQIRKLARDIIAAQEKEIAFMKSWQVKHGK
jgi:uncharacterized protein (DUF305 family)